MKPIVIGVMPPERIRERVQAIIAGSYKPQPDEPKIWFASMKSLAEVLSDDNRALLRIISETNPDSIADLAALTGHKASKLSRMLKKLSFFGIVELERERNQIRPVAKAIEFRIVTR